MRTMRDLTQPLQRELQHFAKEEAGFEPRSGRAAVVGARTQTQLVCALLLAGRRTRADALVAVAGVGGMPRTALLHPIQHGRARARRFLQVRVRPDLVVGDAVTSLQAIHQSVELLELG